MNIYNKLKNTLAPLAPVPFVPITYGGTETTYVTYFQYNKLGKAYAETKNEMAKAYYVQVDLWSTALQMNLEEQIEELLTSNDFCEIKSQDLFEKDTKNYHTAIRATYYDMHS